MGKAFEHDVDHGELCEAFGDDGEGFVMSHETAVAAQPGEGALDDPSSADDLEAAVVVDPFDDLECHRLVGEVGGELVTGIGAVGKDMCNEWEQSPRRADQFDGTITVLDIGREDLDPEEKSYGVDERVALDALRLLARIVADRIAMAPPFSAAFTACVSMMAALGPAARPCASRHWTSTA